MNEIILCNMYGYNIDVLFIFIIMGVGMIFVLVLWYGMYLCDFFCKYVLEMYCFIELFYVYVYCFCCKLFNMC